MLTQYKGRCFRCGKEVLPGKGDIQRIGSLSKKDRKQFAFGYELRHVQMCEEFLDFFKPYFQEKMHDLSISELETVDNNPKE